MTAFADDAPFRRERDRFRVVLPRPARDALLGLAVRYGELLREEDPSSDPAVARLFPPAREDDLLANLEYERVAHDGLLTGRLANVATLERTARNRFLSEEEILAWMGVANDVRLVLGTRLELTEASVAGDFEDDPGRRETYDLYGFLSAVVAAIVEVLMEP